MMAMPGPPRLRRATAAALDGTGNILDARYEAPIADYYGVAGIFFSGRVGQRR